jgi:hypothetical protein
VAAIRQMALWRELRTPQSALLLVTIALCLIRARDQPGLDVAIGATTAHIVPADLALAILFAVTVVVLGRQGLGAANTLALGGGAVFFLLVVITGAINGSTSLVAAVKMSELAVIALATYALVRRTRQIEAIVDLVLVFTIVADVVGFAEFVRGGGGRQSSFLGEHDFAALATLPLLYGLVLTFEGRNGKRAAVAIVAGTIGCILGAALASLLGFYLGVAVLLGVTALRRTINTRGVAVTLVAAVVVTAGTLTIRSGDLGFLQSWFGKPPSRPGQYASSWSQRLIYTYLSGRVFIDHPVLGTGWYELLPPKEFDTYLPAAHRRFSDQPANYFPPPTLPLIPQQTFDQVPSQLGVIGSLAFLALLVGVGRAAWRATRRTPLALSWFAAALGAIAGEALFGGSPLVATFFLVAGVCLALGGLLEVDA